MHLTSQSCQIQDEMPTMMICLRKTVAKEISENGQHVIEGKDHISLKYNK